jgi:hypothetical protein
MDKFYRRAIANVVRYGDTDIFPFPFENFIIDDEVDAIVKIIETRDADVSASLAACPPNNVGALAPVGYTGFRWALQIDPIWNLLYLSWVLSIADEIEKARIERNKETVFSYRYEWNEKESSIFNTDYNWKRFLETAIAKAQESKYVVSCDISEFYLRINHHRIENSIEKIPGSNAVAWKIKAFLSNLSGTYSFGLPVGGPASRIIAELVLNQIDRLLLANEIDFLRYADDYYIFTDSPDRSFKVLVLLTRLLIDNQGLQLQKSKTRIMTSAEFLASNPFVHDDEEAGQEAPLGQARQAIMSLNVHFDPYSPTAAEDYEKLRGELDKYPVMEMIRAEIKKSRANITLSRRLISVSRFLADHILNDAIKTLIESEDILYPVYFNVLISAREVFGRLDDDTQNAILDHVRGLIEAQSRVMVVDLNVQYAVRLLAQKQSEEREITLAKIYRESENDAVRRDIILAMARWKNWHWLSDLKNRFRTLSDMERRAFIIASYGLGDEGEHWRKHLKREFGDFEILARDWAKAKFADAGWVVPL